MTYRELLRTLSSMSADQLDRPVLVTLGNDQDQIGAVEGTQRLEKDAAERFEEEEGTLLLRLT